MTKQYFSKSLLGVLILVLIFGFLAVAPASASKTKNKEPVDRAVFIHYPKGFENRPDVLEQLKHVKPGINCPDPNTCQDYKYSGIHWPSTSIPITYVIDPNNRNNVSPADIQAAIEKGFATWSAAEPAITFIDNNPNNTITGNPTSSRDGLNSFLFRDISAQYPNALAVTFVWYTRFGKTIVETDTIFNDAYDWSYTDPASVGSSGPYGDYTNTGLSNYDVGNIATHEQGHWLMLNDLYNNRDSELTMYGYGAPGEMKKISLGLGDKLGIQKIY